MLSEPGVRICSHNLSSSGRALQPRQGCTEESTELWLVQTPPVIHFLACSDLITSASADSARARPVWPAGSSAPPPPARPPLNCSSLPRVPT